MTITAVEAIPVEVDVTPLDAGGIAPYVSNHDTVESVRRLLIRISTESGVTGWGELLVPMGSVAASRAVVESVIEPELVGRAIGDIRGALDAFYHPYVRIDPFLGGVAIALWDALGRQLGVPVHRLLGGAVRDRIPVAFCLGILDSDRSATHARRAREAGFRVLKTKAGGDWRRDVDRVLAMHEAVDGELEFRLDPNQAWGPEDAVRAAAALEDAGVYLQYLEQPVRVDTYGTYRQLRSRLRTPIAVNEDTYFRHNLQHLLRADAIDAAVIDLVPAGGLMAAREQAALAEQAGVSVAHHCGFDLGIKTAAVLHTVAATPAIDLPPDSVYYAWADHVLETPLAVEDGTLAVPDGPGLGVTVDREAVESLRVDA